MSIWPAYFAAQRADHLAHILHGGRAGLGDGRLDRGLHFVVRHLFGQIAGDDGDLVLLLLDQIVAPALLVEFDRFLALLDHLLQHAHHLGVGERRLALPARLDVGVLERGIDQAQRGDRALVPGLHGFFQGVIDVVAQHGVFLRISADGIAVGLIAQGAGVGHPQAAPVDLFALLQDERLAPGDGLDLEALGGERGDGDTLEARMVRALLRRGRRLKASARPASTSISRKTCKMRMKPPLTCLGAAKRPPLASPYIIRN